MSSVIAIDLPQRPVKKLRRNIVRGLTIFGLTIAHWYAMVIVSVSHAFSGPGIPFPFMPASSDHEMWGVWVRVLEFPLGTMARLFGYGNGNVLDTAQFLNSPLWGMALFFGVLWLIRKFRRS